MYKGELDLSKHRPLGANIDFHDGNSLSFPQGEITPDKTQAEQTQREPVPFNPLYTVARRRLSFQRGFGGRRR